LLCVGAQGSPDADGDSVVTFRHEAENGMLVASDGRGSAVWSRQTGRLACEPVRRDAMLLVAQADPPRLAALDAPTGAELWTVALPSAPVRPPTVSGDTISMESADGEERRSLLDGSLRPPGGLPLE
jgi:outer membrane protein assembly factor BamB